MCIRDSMSTYILVSQDAVLSKTTKMFGQDIHVIGRTCRIHNSVNDTSSPSANALFEDFNFQFQGNMTLTEICPLNGTGSSFKWTFSANAKLRLPVVCTLSSEKINCDSITLRSSQSKEIQLKHYWMEIVEKKLEEEKININKTVFVKSKISPETYTTPTTPALLDSLKLSSQWNQVNETHSKGGP